MIQEVLTQSAAAQETVDMFWDLEASWKVSYADRALHGATHSLDSSLALYCCKWFIPKIETNGGAKERQMTSNSLDVDTTAWKWRQPSAFAREKGAKQYEKRWT